MCDDCQVEAGRIADQAGVSVEVALMLWTTPRRHDKDAAELTALETYVEEHVHDTGLTL